MIISLISELEKFLYAVPAILLAVTIHEYSHGLVARHLGDDTAHDMGLLKLNPFLHLDPLGFILFLWFRLGWSRSLPVDFRKLGGNRIYSIIVLLAGIGGNLLLALFFILLLKLKNPMPEHYVDSFLWYSVVLNINMAVLNLLPVLPLDGGRILRLYVRGYEKYEFLGAMLIMVFIISRYSLWIEKFSKAVFNLFV